MFHTFALARLLKDRKLSAEAVLICVHACVKDRKRDEETDSTDGKERRGEKKKAVDELVKG